MGRFFLLPLLACLGWYLYLYYRGYPLRQGLRGFIWILAVSTALTAIFTVLMWLTH